MSETPGLIELKCRNCGSELVPEDISARLSAVRCRHCDTLFALPAGHGRAAPLPRPTVGLPERFDLHESPRGIRIERGWLTGATYALLVFAILWNGFMLVWHGIALSQGQWMMSAFGLIHTAVGAGLVYKVLADFLNRTVIRVESGALTLRHGPLPWPGKKDFRTADFEQFYVTRKVTHGKNGSTTTYQLEALLAGGRRKTIVKGLPEPEHAIYLEQQLEKHLKIVDRPIDGELAR